jgi:pheromone alpha factor receptor
MASPQSNQTATYTPPADPFTQPITLLLPDGTPFNVTMDQFSWFHSYTTQLAVSRGTALGATFVMLLAVAFLTQRAKRRSPVFALNLAALSFNTFRTLFMAVWVAGPYTDPYAVIAGDWAHITSNDIGSSIAVPVFTFFALGAVLASLLLQVRVAMSTARRRVRCAVLAVCAVMGLASLATEMAVMIVNIKVNILDFQKTANDPTNHLDWALLVEANNLVILLNMCLFTLVFVCKLGFAIWQQVRRLNTAQRFGPLQVLFIMGVQTLVVPSKSFSDGVPC